MQQVTILLLLFSLTSVLALDPRAIFGSLCEPLLTYAPCTCRADPFPTKVSIDCGPRIPLALVTAAFARSKSNVTTHELVHLRLGNSTDIPTDLMGLRSNTRNIQLSCKDNTLSPLTINQNAFRSSRATANHVTIEKCDLRQLDWRFLMQFTVLDSLLLVESSIVNMQSMPLLPSVTAIYIVSCGDFQELYPPEQIPNLTRLQIDNSFNVSDQVFESIVTTAASSYMDKLEILSLVGNKMTRIPSAVGNFTRLISLQMENNAIKTLPTGSLHFSSTQLSTVWLSNNKLQTIQPGAFKGDFSNAVLLLTDNSLTRFQYDVFYDVLETMANDTENSCDIRIQNNPFVCECDLSWLVTENRDLLPKVKGGQCKNLANNPYFEELDKAKFVPCSGLKINVEYWQIVFTATIFYVRWLSA